VRLLLEAYYEPQFSDHSHGFRKGRGCHTALREIREVWRATTWFIEGDISDCFGSLDHSVMAGILSENIHDQRFLRLIRHMLKAGYLEDWEYHDTLSGCPQGGVVSPGLSNIYLNKLDEFVERELIPRYTRGAARAPDSRYTGLKRQRDSARKRGDRVTARNMLRQMRALPSRDPMDPGFRRLRYLRYADDHILGFTGPKAEAEQIKAELTRFLRETLRLELNQDKTLISHARTQPARFLGYHIIVQHCDTRITHGRRSANGAIALRVPPDVIKARPPPTGARENPGTGPGCRTWTPTTSSDLRSRIPGHRELLPSRPGRLAADPAVLVRRDVDAEDPGRQAQVLRGQDCRPLQGEGYHRPRPPGPASKPGCSGRVRRTW